MKFWTLRKMGQRFKKNAIFILTGIIVLSVIFFSVIVLEKQKSIETQISVLEKENLKKINGSVISAFSQIETLNAYFSTVQLQKTEEYLNPNDILWYRSLKARANLCSVLINYVRAVGIKNGENKYEFNADGGFADPEDYGYKNVGEYKTSKVFYGNSDKLLSRLYFKIDGIDNSYSQNTSFIGVDEKIFGKLVLNTQSELRNEYIVDSDGNIVLTNNPLLQSKNLWSLCGIKGISVQEESKQIKYNGKPAYISKSAINGIELYSVSITKREMYSSYFDSANVSNIILGLIMLICSGILTGVILIQTYKPIKDIINFFDDYLPKVNAVNFDEVKYISERIKQLYSANEQLNSTVGEKMKSLRRYHVLALQAQINPHFVCNTFDAINWMTIDLLGKENQISNCIINVADVLYSNMDITNMFYKLREEIEISKKFVKILELRYGNNFDVVFNVDDSLLDFVILKFCLQPIIENAAIHGVANSEKGGTIEIDISRNAHNIQIQISDNGKGMDIEELNMLRDDINNAEIDDSNHIGLRNVNMRIKLLYGDEYGLFIESQKGVGTKCTFLLPMDTF